MSGQPGGHLRAWKGEPAFVSALLTVTNDQPPTICFTQGHGEPDIESFADGGYGTFAEEIRRDAYQTRAVPRLTPDGPPRGLHRAGRRRAAAGVLRRRAGARWIGLLARGGRVLVMLGPVFNHDASGFAHVGLEAFARRWGIGIGDNLVVDPAHASDIEGPSVWMTSDYGGTGGPTGSPAAWAPCSTGWPGARRSGRGRARCTSWPPGTGASAGPSATAPAGAPVPRGRDLVRCSDVRLGRDRPRRRSAARPTWSSTPAATPRGRSPWRRRSSPCRRAAPARRRRAARRSREPAWWSSAPGG